MQTPYAHLLRFILRFILVQDYSAFLQQIKKGCLRDHYDHADSPFLCCSNEMRYFLTKDCGIRMKLLELTAKEHGYD